MRLAGWACALTGVAWCAPVAAVAAPVTGPHQTVEMSFTSTRPGSPSGFSYSATFHNPTDPGADPPALRRLVITAPAGSVIDTSVPERCTAGDDELEQRGEAACPAASRIGAGSADIKPVAFPAVHYETVVFNADHEQKELLTADPPSPPVVVHGYIRGNQLDGPVPTCITGGTAPQDCPSDQVSLLRNDITIPPFTSGRGARRRSYFTTPPRCPRSGAWSTPITFYYGDGAVETLTTRQPCSRPARGRCVTHRRFKLRRLGTGRLRSLVATVRGRRFALDPARRVLKLRHLPTGRFRVKIRAVTVTGRRLGLTRIYRNCSGAHR